ncbi:unnamed protein product [Linum tenue]|nr:unnamed protein product [Linum tenue]
MMLGKSY